MSPITVSNAVLKSDISLMRLAKKTLKEEGFRALFKKTGIFLKLVVKRFFREYLCLKFLYWRSENGKIIMNIQGNKMILNLNDEGISRELVLYGYHELNSTNEVKKIIKPGMRILEIGANIGYYALIETTLAGKNGFLYAFEPSPFNFSLLKKNLEINNIKNTELYQKAIGAKNTTSKFYVADKSNLSSFIKRFDMDMYKNGSIIDMEMITLEKFLEDKEQIDFIRMDVEGYENEVLKGAQNILKINPPKHFFIEIHSELLHKKNNSAREIVNYLRNLGYEVSRSFYRGSSEIFVNDTDSLLNHSLLEKGYWETFLEYKEKKGQ